MSQFLDIITLMLCTGLVTLVTALVLSFTLFFERTEDAVGWWCAAAWALTLGLIVLSFRAKTPMWFGIALGNGVTLLGYGLVAAGFSVFARIRMNWTLLAAGPLVWFACLLLSEHVRQDINVRIVILATIVIVYTVWAAAASLAVWKKERLPSALLATLFCAVHAAVVFLRIPLAWLYPVDANTFLYKFNWFTALTLEGFIQAVFSSFAILVLARERAERRYRQAAEVDSLTAVANRRFFVGETRAILSRKPKAGVMALLDLDFFKRINDTHGHMAGDRVLHVFAQHVTERLEPGMVFGRLGGEEFGLYMRDRSETDAMRFLEDMRAGVEALDIRFDGMGLKVTTSVGVASVEDCGLDFDHLMAGADNALYISKDAGRNRITVFRPAMRLKAIVEDGAESRVSLTKRRVSRLATRPRSGRA